MRIALVTISDRGDQYLPRCLESLEVFLPDADIVQRITVDDREHKLGLSGAVRRAWDVLDEDIDYVWHQEEDFVLTRPVPLERMCRTLEANPRLAQLSLKRGPVSPEEQAAGGFVEMHSADYDDYPGWLEHSRLFSLNPCVYPKVITSYGWPAGGGEREFTDRLVPEGWRFGIWGSRAESPAVEHIGDHRAAGWHL